MFEGQILEHLYGKEKSITMYDNLFVFLIINLIISLIYSIAFKIIYKKDFLARFIITLLGVPAQVLPWTTSKGTNVPPPTPGIATFAHVITPMGPALLNPEIVGGLVKLYTELAESTLTKSGQQIPLLFSGAPFNSADNFVNLGNEIVKIEKNKFKEGKQTKIENNKWLLADPYYRVI